MLAEPECGSHRFDVQVSGDVSQMLGRDLESLLERARKSKKELGDEFVSVEHLLLAFAGDRRFGQGLLKEQGVTEKVLEKAVKEVRGAQKVTDQGGQGGEDGGGWGGWGVKGGWGGVGSTRPMWGDGVSLSFTPF